ncbi:MAG: hypothetical protein UV68_C0014G0019 [Candidatus Collierbacteria bacterium GW2011_GWC2_43_12]|uniref:Uncharacterized protein n=1 Tax=Candidatus Collierbacteria bacterium GW2011_GWC2_43_12 TaxID=1618390 RepID=A0A0G1FGE1_9BACT|nr:MAG: hypothetical protein UV68_C0014G0019 [Candidatus Collierbacteria bacterium GW2011_GWC2_43_12]
MIATIIGQKVSMNLNDFIHGGGQYTKRLVIEELDGLTITLMDNHVTAFFGFDLTVEKCDILGEVNVPDDLVEIAVNYASANEAMHKAIDRFAEVLIGEG